MLGAASERVRILYRVKPRPTVIPLAQRREFFGVQKATENGYELNEHRKVFSGEILVFINHTYDSHGMIHN